MYASVRRYRVDGPVNEFSNIVALGFVPVLERNAGFVSYHIVDGGDGHVISISVFRDAGAAHASAKQASDWVRDNVRQYLPEPPDVMNGEVLVSTLA